MKQIALMACLISLSGMVWGQKSPPIIAEIKGEVAEILPGGTFAYSVIHLKDKEDTSYYRFPPEYGKLVMANVKPGSQVEMKVKIRPMALNMRKRIISNLRSFFNEIVAIKVNGEWIPTIEKPGLPLYEKKIYLHKKVMGDYILYNKRAALLFESGVVAVAYVSDVHDPMKNIQKGDYVSYSGWTFRKVEGNVYPVNPVNEVIIFSPLAEAKGEIKSFLYKQNYVCIGMVVNTDAGELRIGFPSDMAVAIHDFTEKHLEMTIYYHAFMIDRLPDPFALGTLVSGRDTLKTNSRGIYGGEDVNHEHIESLARGKITAVNRSDKDKIMSVIVANDYYIEVDYYVEKQLGSYLKRGQEIQVEGAERIKKDGEIYSKNYRIITPKKITVDGKTFVIGAQTSNP